MRLGGPVFRQTKDVKELVAIHQSLGYSAAYSPYIEDAHERDEFKSAFKEADIVLAELGAYCLNISDPNATQQEANIREIIRKLQQAEEMGARCCVMHGGSYNNAGCVFGHPNNFSRENIEHNVKVIQRILDEVQPKVTKLVLETESYVLPDGPDLYLEILKEINRPGFAVHLDPINLMVSPRHVYNSGDFIRDCFAKLGPYIVSCHAKDTNLIEHATVQITETYVGNGTLDYDAYLTELSQLHQDTSLMIEHLSEQELSTALSYVFGKAEALGLSFLHAEKRTVNA